MPESASDRMGWNDGGDVKYIKEKALVCVFSICSVYDIISMIIIKEYD